MLPASGETRTDPVLLVPSYDFALMVSITVPSGLGRIARARSAPKNIAPDITGKTTGLGSR